LQKEASGILRWMVEGCLAWRKEGLEPPAAVMAATTEYREEMDTVGAFIAECCVSDPNAQVSVKDLYEAYPKWSERHGEESMSRSKFGARLLEKGYKRTRTNAARGWQGLRLTVTQ